MFKILKYCFILFFLQLNLLAQTDKIIDVDYRVPRVFEIAGITVSGEFNVSADNVIAVSGLKIGQNVKVPGDEITDAINKIYSNGLFEQVSISVISVQGNFIYLDIFLKDRPRLSKFSIAGAKKGDADNIREKMNISRGDVVSQHTIMNSKRIIQSYYIDKGFYNADVDITQTKDTNATNLVILDFYVNHGSKMKIKKIHVDGNNSVADKIIHKAMKDTKEKKIYRFWKSSKYIPSDYQKDLAAVISKYHELGFRDARIISDTVTIDNSKELSVKLNVDEGKKYYFGNVSWVGNTIHSDAKLSQILNISRGDVYNQSVLDQNLTYNPTTGRDVSSLYMDDGYLFFSVTPVEKSVDGDTINLEMQIYEGKQATINKVTVSGNTRTNDHVILREIRTKPGQLFSRSDMIRSQRELIQLNYFNAEKLVVNPKPNPIDGTVDMEYVVEEKSTDQFELSGGWGYQRLVGTLGVSFNNFSMRNIFNKKSYRPLPTGDGQRLSIRGQTNGVYYQSYNMSFTEPWLGGKKPNALSASIYHTVMNGVKKSDIGKLDARGDTIRRSSMKITGFSLGLGSRMKWPDDYFMKYITLSYQFYKFDGYYKSYSFTSGNANNFNIGLSLSRSSTYDPIFPKSGTEIMASVTFTPPYSLLNGKDYKNLPDQERYKWLEYHKWKFNATMYTQIAGNLILMTRAKFGFMGMFNKDVGLSSFERFHLGGDGLSGYEIDGREIIGMRGYGNQVLTPRDGLGEELGGTIYSKYTMELRYPLSTNPMATIFVLGFVEAGNTWLKFKDFDPYGVKRSGGLGVRISLPMFGLLGLDYGIPFDDVPGVQDKFKGQFHFSINSSID